ncbi:hypothetical protein R3P38DRAFT_2767601 [Favolaschia claudopus]|uniref:Zn(2)-C6 fungal-type domain-containing protein n=1 Tax=Favolaschia claudopus TaxID=2862362 RepID=A0AAW0CUL2_9AGAR
MSSLISQYFGFFKMMTGTLVMEELSVDEYSQARKAGIRVIPYKVNDAHVVNHMSRPFIPLARTELMDRPTFSRADLECLILLQHISTVRLMQFIRIPSRLSNSNPTYIVYLLEQFKPVSQLIKRFYHHMEITPAFDRVLVGVSSIALWLQTNFPDVWAEPYEVLPQGFDLNKVTSLSVMDQSFTIPDSLEFYSDFPREVLKPNATEHKALYDLRDDPNFPALLEACVENASSAAGADVRTPLDVSRRSDIRQLISRSAMTLNEFHEAVGDVQDRPFADAILTSVVLLASRIPEDERPKAWDRVLPIPERQHLLIPVFFSYPDAEFIPQGQFLPWTQVGQEDPVVDAWRHHNPPDSPASPTGSGLQTPRVAPSTPAIAETPRAGPSALSGPGIPGSGLSFGTPGPALSPPKPAVSTPSVSHPADASAASILEGISRFSPVPNWYRSDGPPLIISPGKTVIPPTGNAEPGPSGEGNASAEDPFVDPTPASSTTAALVMAALTLSTQTAPSASSPGPASPIQVDPPQPEPESSVPELAAHESLAGGGGGGGGGADSYVDEPPAAPTASSSRGRSSSRSRGRGSRGTSVATRRSTRTKIKPDNTLEAVATGLDPDESSAETKPARLSKRRRAELEEADDEESSSDEEGEPEVSPPPKRRKVSEKASAKGKGRAKSEESDDGYVSNVPKLVKRTRGVSQKNKEAPYVPNFDPVIFDQEFAAVALSKLETDFRTLFKDGNNVLQLAGCGNCILRNRKCHRSKFNKDCRACKRGKLSHCSHKFTQMDVIRMIEGFAPITAFSNAGWNRVFTELVEARQAQIVSHAQYAIANRRLFRARDELLSLMTGYASAMGPEAVPGIAGVENLEEGDRQSFEVVYQHWREGLRKNFWMEDGHRADEYYDLVDSEDSEDEAFARFREAHPDMVVDAHPDMDVDTQQTILESLDTAPPGSLLPPVPSAPVAGPSKPRGDP